MNLLNTYVKKENVGKEFAKRYMFKDYIVRGIEQVISKKIKGMSIFLDPEVTYVTLFNLQFSFHNIRPSSYLRQNFLNSSFNNRQEWTGVRLQLAASLLFEWAEQVRVNKGEITSGNFI